jgi:sulfhydrogenase subunit beta (sulfur reductase)
VAGQGGLELTGQEGLMELTRASAVLDRNGLGALIDALWARGFTVIGPTVRDGAIVLDELCSVEELPEGWTDEQDGGTYRLQRRDDGALFGYAVGPHSWKRFLFPPSTLLWRARRQGDGIEVEEQRADQAPRYAFVGARGCDLAAIAVQDRVFLEGRFPDPHYQARRESAFVVAVNCGTAASTCFCTSMGTGPRAERGYDLALTEIIDGVWHEFVVEVGSELGAEVLASVPHQPARVEQERAADAVVDGTIAQIVRRMDTEGIKELLYANYDHPRWDDVANRCLTCGNCTMVCPTCFCSDVEDSTDLSGEVTERRRHWDSCFTLDFSHMGPGSVRGSTKARYRQWMTHKLATWIDQFGTSGCVGCGRCITWCPVGIDLTEEVRAIREGEEA